MQLFQVDGFRNIDRSSLGDRMPDHRENGMVPVWHDDVKSHVYENIGTILKTVNIDITNLTDTFLQSVSKDTSTNRGKFTMNNGAIHYLNLGALAWQDTIPNLELPGNTKVLFDDSNSIGGESTFTFDKHNKLIRLKDVKIQGADSAISQSYRTIVQYTGDRSIALGLNYTKNSNDVNYLNRSVLVGHNVAYNVSKAENIIAIGKEAAYNANNTKDSILIGSSSNKETESNKLYIDPNSYNTLAEARNNSLIYGDFLNKYLHLNGKVEVKEEIRIGDFSRGTAKAGMLAMELIPGDNPENRIRPKYFDNIEWKYFEDSENYYLNSVYKNIENVGTEDNQYKVYFNVAGYGLLSLQLGMNAFNSKPIKDAHGDLTRIQMSTGSPNQDFISYPHFTYNPTTEILKVGKGVLIPYVTDIENPNINVESTFITHNNHAYAYLNGKFRRLDNEEFEGVNNSATNVGSGFEIYKEKDIDNVTFKFRTITKGSRIGIEYQNDSQELLISNLYNVTASSVDDSSTITLQKEVNNSSPNITNIILRKLKSSDNSVQFDVDTDSNYIDIKSTGLGGGEINSGVSLGGDVAIYVSKNESTKNLQFKGVSSSNYIDVIDNTTHFTLKPKNLYSVIQNVDNETGVSIIDTVGNISESDNTLHLDLSKIQGSNGISISKLSNKNIQVSNTIPIEKTVYKGNRYNTLTNKLDFWAEYSADIRNNASMSEVVLGELIIGDNLTYNPTTKVLSAAGGGGTGDKLTDVESDVKYINEEEFGIVDKSESNRTVTFVNESGNNVLYSKLGFLAFQDRYQHASLSSYGVVKVGNNINIDTGVISVPVATTNNLGVVKIGDNLQIAQDGTISGNPLQDAVLFDRIQYYKYDSDNEVHELDNYDYSERIARRTRARNNTGSAYISGSLDENFNTKDLTASGWINATNKTPNGNHTIGGFLLRTPYNTISEIKGVYPIVNFSNSIENGSRLQLHPYGVSIKANGNNDSNVYDVRDKDNKVFMSIDFNKGQVSFDGDLIVRGSIKAGGAFDVHKGDDIDQYFIS